VLGAFPKTNSFAFHLFVHESTLLSGTEVASQIYVDDDQEGAEFFLPTGDCLSQPGSRRFGLRIDKVGIDVGHKGSAPEESEDEIGASFSRHVMIERPHKPEYWLECS
jgi:hypothetical protein